ncbi:MAG: metallophosphoesterase [Nanoarchaeota archaeon]
MKILATVDIHGNRKTVKKIVEKAKEADVIISAGDVSIFGNGLDAIYADFNSIGKPVIIIHGNHETDEETRKATGLFKNLHFIHGKHLIIEGVLFLGWGGGGFAQRDKEFEKKAKEFRRIVGEHQKVVLVTHAPPFGTTLDLLGDDYQGCKSFTDFLKSIKITLLIAGHLHENAGMEDEINDCMCINPGPEGKILEI